MTQKILVLGANGTVGTHLVKALIARGESVKAASRSGTAPAGAEGVVFDFAQPEGFDALLDGVDRLYLMLPAGNVNILELLEPIARKAIARNLKVVFQSVFGVDADDSIPYRQIELMLERADIPYVILRPNWFMDNFHSYWLEGIRQGVIVVPAAEGQSAFIDTRDIAAAAAAALTRSDFDRQAFNLTGPAAHGYAEAAALISAATRRTITYQPIADADFIQLLISAGVPSAYAELLTSIFYPVREGWTAAVSDAVKTLTGQPPRTLAQYVKDHVDAFKA